MDSKKKFKKNCPNKINPNSAMIHKTYKLNKKFTI